MVQFASHCDLRVEPSPLNCHSKAFISGEKTQLVPGHSQFYMKELLVVLQSPILLRCSMAHPKPHHLWPVFPWCVTKPVLMGVQERDPAIVMFAGPKCHHAHWPVPEAVQAEQHRMGTAITHLIQTLSALDQPYL